jgi:hypothetical protein
MNTIRPEFRIDVRCGQMDPKTNKITWKTELESNLINNGGMAMLADYWVTECTENIYLESGGRINARYSGTTLLSQSGTTVTSDNAFFLNDGSDAIQNRLIVFDDGTQTWVTGYTAVDEVEVGTNAITAAQPATIYYVEETQMDGFVKASTTAVTSGGANTNTWTESAGILTVTNKRTISFPAESATTTYEGVGWTPNVGDNQQVFGRKVIQFTVDIGTQAIIEVTINRRVDCTSDTFTNLFVGTSIDGSHINQIGAAAYNNIAYYSSINTSTGATVAPTVGSTFLECKSDEDVKMIIGEYAGALDLTNIDVSGSTYAEKTITPTYTIGNFYIDYIATFTKDDLVTADLRTIAITNNTDATEAFYRYLFDSSINFESKRFNNLTIRKAWSRYY